MKKEMNLNNRRVKRLEKKIRKLRAMKLIGLVVYCTVALVLLCLILIRIDYVCKTEIMLREHTVRMLELLEPAETKEAKEEPVQVLESLGEFRISHYCACEKCCGIYASGYTATGTRAVAGRTVAVDPRVIPYGTVVVIDGRMYVAEDCGGSIKGNKIDIFCDTHEDAMRGGVKSYEVFTIA